MKSARRKREVRIIKRQCWTVFNESYVEWKAVLSQLKSATTIHPSIILADGDKGIKRAVSEVFPDAHFFFCNNHRYARAQLKLNKKDRTTYWEMRAETSKTEVELLYTKLSRAGKLQN